MRSVRPFAANPPSGRPLLFYEFVTWNLDFFGIWVLEFEIFPSPLPPLRDPFTLSLSNSYEIAALLPECLHAR